MHKITIQRDGEAKSYEAEILEPERYVNGLIRCGVVQVSTALLVDYLGVTRKTLAEWEKRGCPKIDHGKWDLIAVLRWKGILKLPPVYE